MDLTIEKLKTLKLLYAEDDSTLLNSVHRNLSFFFKDVFIASDGEEAIEVFNEEKIDIIILDINMPKKSGLEVAEYIREKDLNIPIIFLTAFSEQNYLMDAVKFKLEDYLLKPASIEELLEVFEKIFRIDTHSSNKVQFQSGIIFDREKRLLFQEKDPIKLGAKEEKLLTLLCDNAPEIVSKTQINEVVWDNSMSEISYRNIIRNLRNKIGEESLETVSGVGLRVVEKNSTFL